eukprot:c27634_g1_i1 orf=236-1633(-)
MTMESFATPYPVIFYDGEQEHDRGHIGVHSVLNFKRFQALLSQKIGLPANQLAAVFVCRRTSKNNDKRQKLPVNENTNFNIILNRHNPSREKDCHFLVALKKSKRERKGTTKRNAADSDNGDEDESASPGRDTSPEETPKMEGSADGASSPEASSPVAQDLELFSDGRIGTSQNTERHFGTSFSYRKPPGAEKILLRRETGGQIPGSAAVVWQNGHQIEKGARALGFQNTESDAPRISQLSARRQEDTRLTTKQRMQDKHTVWPIEKSVPPMSLGQPQLRNFTSRSEVSQERRNDGRVINNPAMSAVLLQRNGTLTPPAAVAAGNSFSPSTSLPLVHPASIGAGTVLSRAPTSSSGGVVHGSSAAWNLQQAQAHYLSLQKQHPAQTHMNPQTIAMMKGVVRGLASIDSGIHQSSGACGYCCSFKERNIYPTPFHLCAQDRVTMGFGGPSPAGPIERPVKRLAAAA